MQYLILTPFLEITAIWLHEAGHFSVARLLGVPARLKLRWYGVAVQVGRASDTHALAPWKDLLIAAGGPAASFLTAYALWHLCLSAALLSAFFGLVALVPLPFKCQDGYRMLLASWRALSAASAGIGRLGRPASR